MRHTHTHTHTHTVFPSPPIHPPPPPPQSKKKAGGGGGGNSPGHFQGPVELNTIRQESDSVSFRISKLTLELYPSKSVPFCEYCAWNYSFFFFFFFFFLFFSFSFLFCISVSTFMTQHLLYTLWTATAPKIASS